MRKLFFLLVSMLVMNLLYAQRTVLHCGQLIDVKNLQVLKEMSVIIEANKITDVQKGYTAAAAGDKLVDLKNKTVIHCFQNTIYDYLMARTQLIHMDSEIRKNSPFEAKHHLEQILYLAL